MRKTYIDFVFEGPRFSPRKLKELTGLPMEALAEFGEVSIRGRYKGEKSPYGLGLLKVDSNGGLADISKAVSQITKELINRRQELKESGVEEITLDVENLSQSDIEITIDKNLIQTMSQLNASIDISNTIEEPDQGEEERRLLKNIFVSFEKNAYYASLSSDKRKKVQWLFHNKFDETEILKRRVSQATLMTALVYYLLKYTEEQDLGKVPTFDSVLKEQ